jgi:hypothetical protein
MVVGTPMLACGDVKVVEAAELAELMHGDCTKKDQSNIVVVLEGWNC